MDKVRVMVELVGCDDVTVLMLDMRRHDAEWRFLETLRDASKREATYGCMPVLEFSEVKDD